MATDIAFAIGLVSLLGNRIDRRLKVFLLSLAIVDDLGAIAVIALFYTETIGWTWFGAAAVVLAITIGMRAMRVWYVPVYVALGVLLWVCMLKSGVHATVAGVLMGFIAPAKPLQSKADAARWVGWLATRTRSSSPPTSSTRRSICASRTRWPNACRRRSIPSRPS